MAWIVGIGIFLFLLFLFPRAVLALVAVCGVGLGGVLFWNDLQSKERARERASITISVLYNLDSCTQDYPLFVSILNGSENILESVSFGVEGHRVGYSEPLYDSGYLGFSSDRIIASRDGWANCWSLPNRSYRASEQLISLNPPNGLIWTAKNVSPRFKAR